MTFESNFLEYSKTVNFYAFVLSRLKELVCLDRNNRKDMKETRQRLLVNVARPRNKSRERRRNLVGLIQTELWGTLMRKFTEG